MGLRSKRPGVVAGQRPPDCTWQHLPECYNAYVRIFDCEGLAVKMAVFWLLGKGSWTAHGRICASAIMPV